MFSFQASDKPSSGTSPHAQQRREAWRAALNMGVSGIGGVPYGAVLLDSYYFGVY